MGSVLEIAVDINDTWAVGIAVAIFIIELICDIKNSK